MNEFFLTISMFASLIQADLDIHLLPSKQAIDQEMPSLRLLLMTTERDVDFYKNFGWHLKSQALEMEKWLFVGRARYEMLNHVSEVYKWIHTIEGVKNAGGNPYDYEQHRRQELSLYWWRAFRPVE